MKSGAGPASRFFVERVTAYAAREPVGFLLLQARKLRLLLGGAEMCMPGDNVTVEIDLMGKAVAMEKGVRFAVREGGKTIGSGVVVEIIE